MDSRWWAQVYAGLGVILAIGAFWHLFTDPIGTGPWHWPIVLILLGSAVAAMMYGSYWHFEYALPDNRYPRILGWIALTTLLFMSLGTITVYNASEAVTPTELFETLHLTASLGLSGGLLVGTIEARAIQIADAAARAEARSLALEAEQERVDELNDLFRHYILNGATIISGYADELRTGASAEDQRALDAIDTRADAMATLVSHMRKLSRNKAAGPQSAAQLEALIEAIRSDTQYATDVTMEVSDTMPDVTAPEGVRDCLHLLVDGLTKVIDEGGTITIRANGADADVTLRIVATPAELPDPVDESLFEPIGAGVGLDLYLAKEVADQIGEFWFVETPDERLEFALRFSPGGTALASSDEVGDDSSSRVLGRSNN